MAEKYLPMVQWLTAQPSRSVTATFAELDALVDGLPPSASRYRAWWSNTPSHTQAVAWMDAGWRVDAVDLAARRVTFVRGG